MTERLRLTDVTIMPHCERLIAGQPACGRCVLAAATQLAYHKWCQWDIGESGDSMSSRFVKVVYG